MPVSTKNHTELQQMRQSELSFFSILTFYFLSALRKGCDEDPQRNSVVGIGEGGHRQPEFDFGVAQTVHLGGIKSPDHVFVVRVAQLERKADHLRSQNTTKLRLTHTQAFYTTTNTRKMRSL